MRKVRVILAAIFCTGVFLAGAGTGIAFLEFSSFTYTGEKQVGDVDMRTVTLEHTFEATEDEPLRVNRRYGQIMTDDDIKEDEAVPENMVRFRVTYNAEEVEPFLNGYEDLVFLDYFYLGDDFKNFMESKDMLLEGIKNREIAMYTTTGIEDVEVMVNPESRKLVRVD